MPALLGHQGRRRPAPSGRWPMPRLSGFRMGRRARAAPPSGGEDAFRRVLRHVRSSPARSVLDTDRQIQIPIVRPARSATASKPGRSDASDGARRAGSQPVAAGAAQDLECPHFAGSGRGRANLDGGGVMKVRQTLRTLAILGLGGILGGGLVVAMSGERGRRGRRRPRRARTRLAGERDGAGRADPRVEEGQRLGLDLGEGRRGRLAQRPVRTSPGPRRLALATRGEVFDLGLTYSRRSYKWPGHSPARSSRSAARTASTG